jgi:uncharacterized protein (TIGR02646 family)
LCPNETRRLTDEYKTSARAVWNFDKLKQALLETSHKKCAYCECDLSKECKYMEVEHFRDKARYPEDVVFWPNLLPSCKRCNVAKGDHDVTVEQIVNPYEVNPKDHFSFRLYRLKAKSALGKRTLDVLDLNNLERVVQVRFEIGEAIQWSLEIAIEKLNSYKISPTTRNKNRVLAHTRKLLSECQAFSSYAATSATVLQTDEKYHYLKKEMQNMKFWDQELEDLDSFSISYALDLIA